MKKLDRYLISKYFLSYLFINLIFIVIAVVIDFTEKLGPFIEKEINLGEILMYYAAFIPHIASLLAPLFLFVSVILFTSKLASNSEFISMLGNGISFYRILRPYLISAFILTGVLIFANNWLVPEANKIKLNFLNRYIHFMSSNTTGINLSLDKTNTSETIISLPNFSFTTQEGYQFSLEKYEDNELVYQLVAPRIKWKDDIGKWEIRNYEEWFLKKRTSQLVTGTKKDTVLGFSPSEFIRRMEEKETLNYAEMNRFIEKEKSRKTDNVIFFEVEKHNRTASASAVIILTVIGVALSMRKKRGGTGLNIALGLALSALFMLFLRFSTTFATNSNLPAIIAVWIPNIIFGILAFILIRRAPK